MTENLHSYVCTAESCYYWRHYKMSKKETWWEEARRLTYLMILQRFVSHCYHCFLEWKERGAGHMRIEEEVEEGPIWEKPTRKCPSPYQVVLWRTHRSSTIETLQSPKHQTLQQTIAHLTSLFVVNYDTHLCGKTICKQYKFFVSPPSISNYQLPSYPVKILLLPLC